MVHQKVIQDMTSQADDFLNKNLLTVQTYQKLIFWINNFLFTNSHFSIFDTYTINHLLLKFFFPKFTFKELGDIFNNSKNTRIWCILIVCHYINAFQEFIWLPKCKKVK